MDLVSAQNKLREISKIALEYRPDPQPVSFGVIPTEFRGYSEATLRLAVHKKMPNTQYAQDQAAFMKYLGSSICPKILAMGTSSYCMQFLFPVEHNAESLVVQEQLLAKYVWTHSSVWIFECLSFRQDALSWQEALKSKINIEVPEWAMEEISVIHGDPTLDNVLMTADGFLRITDPIPPQWLGKPSIKGVDHGKLLQSFLGWEVVLRGMEPIRYEWPLFMQHGSLARRAIFWAMVAVKRIAYRDMSDSITQWANKVAKELEQCVY